MRRLRQWQHHERMTVAMAVAEAAHHSAPRRQKTATAIREEVELESHTSLRAQKTPPPGVRPGSLAEPGPQRNDRTVRHSSKKALLTLGLLVLAGASGETVDASALGWLTVRALNEQRWAEDEEGAVAAAEARGGQRGWRRGKGRRRRRGRGSCPRLPPLLALGILDLVLRGPCAWLSFVLCEFHSGYMLHTTVCWLL